MNRLFKPNKIQKKDIQTQPGGGALIITKIMFGEKIADTGHPQVIKYFMVLNHT